MDESSRTQGPSRAKKSTATATLADPNQIDIIGVRIRHRSPLLETQQVDPRQGQIIRVPNRFAAKSTALRQIADPNIISDEIAGSSRRLLISPIEKRAFKLRQDFNRRMLENYSQEKRQPGVGKGGIKRLAEKLIKQHSRVREAALTQLRRAQRLIDDRHSIPRLPFHRLVKEIFRENNYTDYKIQVAALEALHSASEAELLRIFERSYLFTIHAKRITLMQQDLQLTGKIDRWAN